MNVYERLCREDLARIGRSDVPPQVMEASMRAQYGTLGHLDKRTFRKEAKIAAGMWDADPALCRRMVESEGLRINDENPTR